MDTTEIPQQTTAAIYFDGVRHLKHSAIDLISGSVGATVSVYIGQPLDTVKVKLQTFPSMYKGLKQCFVHTLRKEGVRGLYAGTTPALTANIAENSILFAAYGICQKLMAVVARRERVEDLTPLENATSGFFAAFFSSLALCPTELVKCRLQALHELSLSQNLVQTHVTPVKMCRDIFRSEGVPGFFRGLTSTMTREMPGYFVFFGVYELCKGLLATEKEHKAKELEGWKTIICGGCAGSALWISVFPADVAKSRIQVSGSKTPMIKEILNISRTEGIRALYKGLGATVLRTFPATGGLFFAYEWTKKALHDAVE